MMKQCELFVYIIAVSNIVKMIVQCCTTTIGSTYVAAKDSTLTYNCMQVQTQIYIVL